MTAKSECYATGGAHEEDRRLRMEITWAKVRVCLHCRVLYVANLTPAKDQTDPPPGRAES